jgi:hypothetical protein
LNEKQQEKEKEKTVCSMTDVGLITSETKERKEKRNEEIYSNPFFLLHECFSFVLVSNPLFEATNQKKGKKKKNERRKKERKKKEGLLSVSFSWNSVAWWNVGFIDLFGSCVSHRSHGLAKRKGKRRVGGFRYNNQTRKEKRRTATYSGAHLSRVTLFTLVTWTPMPR